MDFEKRLPTLFVGLGGAGGSIVNRIATILKGREDWELLKNSMQLFVLDTDKADLDRCTSVPQAHRFAISGFDKGLWVREKLGRGGVSNPQADPRVTQWVHDWYNFRSSQGAGAGQIRIESRVSLYNHLESSDLIKRLENAILSTIDMNNTMLSYEVKKFNVFIYYTVAGGTGSGAHLMFAAFLRHIIGNFGWSANITGISMLSTLVQPYIRNMRQRGDIHANGYSAMKEDEHLMHLKVFSDMRDPGNRREFIYHPYVSNTEVTESPYDFIYVLDTNPEVHLANFQVSTADAIYLQLFSPIFAHRNSDYDNYEKNQKRLARGLYSTFYGSYGCSVLVLPDRDLLEYCCKRKTADVIRDYLSNSLVLDLPSDPEDYAPTTEQLELLDAQSRVQLWDDRFVQYMRDRVVRLEETTLNQVPERNNLKPYGRELYDAGFGLGLELPGLRDKVAILEVEGMSVEDQRLLNRMILPPAVGHDQVEAPDHGDDGADTSPVALNYRSNMEPFLFSYGNLASSLGSLIRMTNGTDHPIPESGLFREFWNKLDEDFISGAVREIRFEHARTRRDASARSETWDEMLDVFRDNIRRNRADLTGSRERVQNLTNTINATLRRSFISDFLAHQESSFEVQRLFVTVHIQLSKAVCAVLKRVLSDNGLDEAIDSLARTEDVISGNQELRDAARTGLHEWVAEIAKKTGAEDFSLSTARLDRWVEILSCRVEALIFVRFYLSLHTRLLEVFKDLGETFRLFSRRADHEIQNLHQEAEQFRNNPGGKAQAEQYHNDIEALQGFDGERLWNDYYDYFVRSSVDIRQEEIRKTIAAIFSDKRLVTARDQIDQIRIVFRKSVESALEPKIVGAYKSGKEKRGLTLQQALVAEAHLAFRRRLQAIGRWAVCQKNWEQIATEPGLKLHSRSLRELSVEMTDFARNYLETKIATCVRRSAIMANIDMEDRQVTEYACLQSLVCYDFELYGEPKSDTSDLGFPHLVRRIKPEFIAKDFPAYGKMAVFYQAILGIPLFVFRNLMTIMKEAYNKRVGERDWMHPQLGRQYPLHIDRNWEPGDPGVDDNKLPLSLDPDEAVVSSRRTNAERCRFFAYWMMLHKAGDIVRDDVRGFIVPAGKLGNGGSDIILGRSVREAIQAMMKSHSAHDTLDEAYRGMRSMTIVELEEQLEIWLAETGGDVWGNGEPDPELGELADLLQEYIVFLRAQEKEQDRREKRRHMYEERFGPQA